MPKTENADIMEAVIGWSVLCPNCDQPIKESDPDDLESYLPEEKTVECPTCGETVALRKIIIGRA